MRLVTIFGGSGFLGRYVVRHLASKGYFVRVIVRKPNEALFLKVYGNVGQIQLVGGDIKEKAKLSGYIEGSDCVVNCVATFFETRTQTFNTLHVNAAREVAEVSKNLGVKQFIHISSLGASSKSASGLLKSKGMGEDAVLKAFPNANIIRPSLIYGAEDTFFNRFANLSMVSPVIPVVGAETKFQPVYVDDVAKAVGILVEQKEENKYLDLGGTEVFTFKELIDILLSEINRNRIVLKIPFALAKAIAFTNDFFRQVFGDIIPASLTMAQVKSLEHDNVIGAQSESFSDLEIIPRKLKIILPSYLQRFKKIK